MILFNYEFTGHDVNKPPYSQEHMDDLCRWHGAQLDIFKIILVEQIFWDSERRNQQYLAGLLSPDTILITDTSH